MERRKPISGLKTTEAKSRTKKGVSVGVMGNVFMGSPNEMPARELAETTGKIFKHKS